MIEHPNNTSMLIESGFIGMFNVIGPTHPFKVVFVVIVFVAIDVVCVNFRVFVRYTMESQTD